MEVGDTGGGVKDKIRFPLNTDLGSEQSFGIDFEVVGAVCWRVPVQTVRISGRKESWPSSGRSRVANRVGAVALQRHLELRS